MSRTVCRLVPLMMIAIQCALAMVVDPGRWELESVSNQPGESLDEQVTTRRVKDKSIEPHIFMREVPGCRVSNLKSSSTSMSCDTQPGPMTELARFNSTGSSLRGTMSLSGSTDGQLRSFERSWTGRRTDPC